MRIISDHRDYYDCVQSQGQDLTCTWVRHFEECVFDGWPFPKVYSFGHYRDSLLIRPWIVGFCGKVYPILDVEKYYTYPAKTALCHSMNDVDRFVTQHFTGRQIETYRSKSGKHSIGIRRYKLAQFYDECKQQQDAFTSIFVENGCPVFVARYRQSQSALIFHGRKNREQDVVIPGVKVEEVKRGAECDSVLLKDLEFYKYFPTHNAFQEIHMYLSGVLGFANPHVPVPDDVTMRDIKGFDKWSFKKEPTR